MDTQTQKVTPDYILLYSDILTEKFPEKKYLCEELLSQDNLSVWEIIELNRIIFNNTDKFSKKFNQRRRSYHKPDIIEVLDYQKKHKLNNTQLAKYFELSQSTLTKWKKIFLV